MPNEDHGTMWANPRFQERYIAAFNGLTQLMASPMQNVGSPEEPVYFNRTGGYWEKWEEMFNTLKGEQDGR